jgi:quercetin dioxygenase-like cupin family protein
MTDTTIAAPFKLSPEEGEAHWWTGALATIKITAEQTGGRMSIVEVACPDGYETPPHVHHAEEESFWILEGRFTFTVADVEIPAAPGDFVFGPRDVPHRFRVDQGPARLLYVFTPGGFEGFVREAGVPALERTVPPADVQPDLETLPSIAARYGAELLMG